MDHKELEKLNFSKQDVLGIIDRRVVEWNKNWMQNKIYILEAYAVKTLIKAAPADKFEHFWKVFIRDIDAVRYENARKELPDVFKQIDNSSSDYKLDFTKLVK